MIQNVGNTYGNSPTTLSSSSAMGKEDFLRLLTVQMQHQSPLEPVSQEQMVAMLTQFSSLEQLIELNGKLDTNLRMSEFTQATGLVGKDVKGMTVEGDVISGTVRSVRNDGVGLILSLEQGEIPLSFLMEVHAALPAAEQ